MTQTSSTSRKDIREAEKALDIRRRAHIEFLVQSLATRSGRVWFWDFLSECQVFVSAPAFNPHIDYFNHGQRNVGMRILADILAHCPDQYLLMIREANDRLSDSANPTQRPGGPSPVGGPPGSADPGSDEPIPADELFTDSPYRDHE